MMKKLIITYTCITFMAGTLLFSCKVGRDTINDELSVKDNLPVTFIVHDDFSNLLMHDLPEPFIPEALNVAAQNLATSGAGIISLRVSEGERVYFHPSYHGESYGIDNKLINTWIHGNLFQLVEAGIDPYGTVINEIQRQGIPVLAKFRMNDRHHVAGHSHRASKFWHEHPEWRIGQSELNTDIAESFDGHPSIAPETLETISRDRPLLLDYAIPEVREKRLAIFREVIERYDVAGATLNFLREPYCISFPEKNAGYLTDFIRSCRQILDEVLGAKGIEQPIMGALLPLDIDFCRAMGMEVDVWITEGLLDYVSPSPPWVTNFNADIEPWVDLAKGTGCKVYPAIVGMIAFQADFCLPEQYEIEGRRVNSAKIMPEHVRAIAHRFYAEGADGLSSFNLYSSPYSHLFPLSELSDPELLNSGERSYIYMTDSRQYQSRWDFLQLHLPANASKSRSHEFRMYERLNGAGTHLRFKAWGLEDVAGLGVSVNGRDIPPGRLGSLPHDGSGFLYLQCQLEPGDIRDGNNEITFSLSRPVPAEVIVQEIEILVKP